MTITFTLNGSMTLDESATLQNATATPSVPGDADDNDVTLARLQSQVSAFYNRLFGTSIGQLGLSTTFPTGGRVAESSSNFIGISATATVSNLAFTDANGDALNGADSGLDVTSDNANVLLYTDPTNDNIVLGRASTDGRIVFAAYIQEVYDGNGALIGAKIWMVTFEAIEHGNTLDHDDATSILADTLFVSASEELSFDLNTLASGQNNWNAFGDQSNQIIVISDQANQTVNTSKGGGNTTIGNTNQLLDGVDPSKDANGEAMVFTFVSNSPSLLTLDKGNTNAITYDTLLSARSAEWQISQTQGGSPYAQASMVAYTTAKETGGDFVPGLQNDTIVAIHSVTIRSGNTILLEAIDNDLNTTTPETDTVSRTIGKGGNQQTFNLSVTFNGDGTVTIVGLRAKDFISYETVSDHNRVKIANTGLDASNLDWDIGAFKLLEVASSHLDIGPDLLIEDSGPTATGTITVQLDDETETGGIAGGTGDVDPNTANTTGTVGFAFGADGAGSVAWLDTGAPSGFTYEKSGNDLLIKQSGNTVVTLTMNTATGAYTVTQERAIAHPSLDGLSGDDTENDVSFTVTYQVTDGDGDTATNTVTINADDDTPTATGTITVQLDDETETGGIAGGTGDVDPNTANTTGTVGFAFGADGAGSVAWLDTGAPSGFTYEKSGDNLLIKQSGNTVITLTMNTATGAYTVTQERAIAHPSLDGQSGDDTENDVSFTVTYQVNDGDGDKTTNTITINADDDTPTATGTITVQLDDETETGGIAGGTGDVDPNTANTSGTVGFAFGADGAGSVEWLATGAPSGFTYEKSGNDLLIKQSGNTVITLTMNTATGAYTVTQERAIAHPSLDGLSGDDTENDVSFTVTYQVNDGDGDKTTNTITINADDDTPTATGTITVQLDDETETGGNAGGTGDVDPNTANTSGTVGFAFGADGAGLVEWLTTGQPSGFTYVKDGNNLLIKQSTTTVITLTMNTATGAYTVTQDAAILHPTLDGQTGDNTENDVSFTVTYQVSDGDGDKTTNTITINADDDTPTIAVNDITGLFNTNVKSSTWSDLSGADGFKSLNITLNSYQIDSNSAVTVNTSLGTLTAPDGNGNFVFTGSITDDFTNDGVVNNQTVNYTLTFDPDADTYDFQITAIPSSTTTLSSAAGSLDAGGPDPVRTLTVATKEIVFSAVNATANASDIKALLNASEGTIQSTATYLSAAQMNVSTAGIGLGNNNFDGNANGGVDGATTQGGAFDESFVVDPHFLFSGMKIYIDNSVGGYNPSTEGIFYRVYYSDGTVGDISAKVTTLTPEAGGQVSFFVGSTSGPNNIDAVQLFMGSGTVKIPVIEFSITEQHPAQPLDLDFTATLFDNDNDSHQDTFSVDLDAVV
ncbi:DUF5801 repeats-in-toxin domain-containing protein (plasmid) [Ensifer adhaerens]|uniref:beta strand repeat-containing protein n=1 Tax=Ensifer adhaerens TaxID=106592 RepID=UPI0023A99E5C|nr:DUF5801 repeats-in-toxin domain-containing protein [Ensifer adhaerens]WDZ81683.1 DUF5801 repeats-in-toxin domain-containing protein [Ensifer adhaerens]